MVEKTDVHALLNLTAVNDGQLPIKMYIEMDVNLLGLKVLNVGLLILEESDSVLNKTTSYKTSRHHSWNMVWLTYQVFMENMGKRFLTPFNVQEELIHSCSLTSVHIIMMRFLKITVWECGLFTTRPTVTFSLSPQNWLTWLKQSPTILP